MAYPEPYDTEKIRASDLLVQHIDEALSFVDEDGATIGGALGYFRIRPGQSVVIKFHANYGPDTEYYLDPNDVITITRGKG